MYVKKFNLQNTTILLSGNVFRSFKNGKNKTVYSIMPLISVNRSVIGYPDLMSEQWVSKVSSANQLNLCSLLVTIYCEILWLIDQINWCLKRIYSNTKLSELFIPS